MARTAILLGKLMRSPVSVVIPCYRCSETIDRAVGSVMRQTWPPKEILLIEDCSDDGGVTLAALYRLQKLHRAHIDIRVIQFHENVGPGAARNAGWNMAQEPYISFLDADDSWHERKMEIQYQWMDTHPEVMMTGHKSTLWLPDSMLAEVSDQLQARQVHGHSMLISNRFPTRTVMLRKNLPCRFDSKKRHAEDYLLWLQIVLGGWQAWFIDSTLAYSYKEDFGQAGLSKNLWQMERGVLDALQRIRRENLISRTECLSAMLFSILKFIRRLVWVRAYPNWKR